MLQMVITKDKEKKYIIATKNILQNTPRNININQILFAIKEIEKTTSKINTIILALKINQLLYLYDPNYNYSRNNELFSEHIVKTSNVIFDLTSVLSTNFFDFLEDYSLLYLLDIMRIPKEYKFLLINSLVMVNDTMRNSPNIVLFTEKKEQMTYIKQRFIKELCSMNVYLNYLFNDKKDLYILQSLL